MASAKSKEAAADLGIQDAETLGLGSEYDEVEFGEINKWEDHVGEIIKGKVHKIRPAGQGNVVELIHEDNTKAVYGCPKILHSKLEENIGSNVAIICTGKNVETQNGIAWGFRVFVKNSKF